VGARIVGAAKRNKPDSSGGAAAAGGGRPNALADPDVPVNVGLSSAAAMPDPSRSLPANRLGLPLLGLPCFVLPFLGLHLLVIGAAPLASAASLPYPEAVSKARLAAEAVLHRAGRETCLRGKLNRALLKLSESCEANGQSATPLCSLSEKAVVVTPMSLSFMDATSKQLLELSAPQPGQSR
jgi:hypothetical protein